MTEDITPRNPLSLRSNGIAFEQYRLTLFGFRTFQIRSPDAFQLSLTVLSSIGLGSYLGLGVSTPIFTLVSPSPTLDPA